MNMNAADLTDLKPTPDQARLEPWFAKVADPDDWKRPIHAYVRIHNQDLALVEEAIIFYTATTPAFKDMGDGWSLVTAPGYRRGPAGDH